MAFSVDIRFVSEAERKLGVKFPASFVVRMVKNNGGEANAFEDSWQLHPFLDPSDRKRLKRTCNDIVLETKKAREWSGFPKTAIVIGSNGGGDRLFYFQAPTHRPFSALCIGGTMRRAN